MKHLLFASLFLVASVQADTSYEQDIDTNMIWADDGEFQMSSIVNFNKEPFSSMSGKQAADYIDQNMLWANDNEFQTVNHVINQ